MSSLSHEKEYSVQRIQELKQDLRRQKYPVDLINDGINRAKDISFTQLRTTRLKEERQDEKIPFVITRNLRNHIFLFSKMFFLIIIEQSENIKNF